MDIPSDLERRIRILEDIEAIKKLKARYWNSVDSQDWNSLADCLAEDLVFESPHLGQMEGREHILRVLKRSMKNVKTAHQGHSPEIEIIDDRKARAIWGLNDKVESQGMGVHQGYGKYEDEYIKTNGNWKIAKSRLNYIFRENTVINRNVE